MAKFVILLVVGFVLSSIDLIPVLWYLDDLITVPIGLIFEIRLILSNIMNECRVK